MMAYDDACGSMCDSRFALLSIAKPGAISPPPTSRFFFSSRRRHTRSVSAFLLNRSSDLERPVKAAELFAFTLRVRAGNTDVLTDAEENVRQKLRAEGVM